jgi:hypothetical protein
MTDATQRPPRRNEHDEDLIDGQKRPNSIPPEHRPDDLDELFTAVRAKYPSDLWRKRSRFLTSAGRKRGVVGATFFRFSGQFRMRKLAPVDGTGESSGASHKRSGVADLRAQSTSNTSVR